MGPIADRYVDKIYRESYRSCHVLLNECILNYSRNMWGGIKSGPLEK